MRFYRALLYLYPKSFRVEYGAEILSVIADRRRVAGPGGRLALAAETVGDTMMNALRIHLEILLQDVRYTVRALRRSPAFAITATVLTALGIGATTAALAVADHVLFRPLPDRTFDNGCSALGAVQLIEIGTPVTNLGAMTCPLADRFSGWVRDSVQSAARAWLGSQVVRIESFGTYSCRNVNSQIGGRLSEHGRANAVDIAAFILADGRRITVLKGWNGPDEDVRRFLRAVHDSGCRRFAIGLGPDANAQHANHLHFDLGRNGPYCR